MSGSDAVAEEMLQAEKGLFDARLRKMEVAISFAPGVLQIFEKLQPTYYVSRDAELFDSTVRAASYPSHPPPFAHNRPPLPGRRLPQRGARRSPPAHALMAHGHVALLAAGSPSARRCLCQLCATLVHSA